MTRESAETHRCLESFGAPPGDSPSPPSGDEGLFFKPTYLVTVKVAAAELDPIRVVIETEVFRRTETDWAVKLPALAPAGTMNEDGTLTTEEFEEETVTICPPDGAGFVRVTV